MEVKNIFLVEDDGFFADTFSKRLKAMGDFEVHVYDSAEKAMDELLQVKPEIIFLDHILGGVNGVDALPVIKSKLPKCEVCIVSNQRDVEVLGQALKNGAANYFMKDALVIQNTKQFIEKISSEKSSYKNFWKRFKTELS